MPLIDWGGGGKGNSFYVNSFFGHFVLGGGGKWNYFYVNSIYGHSVLGTCSIFDN